MNAIAFLGGGLVLYWNSLVLVGGLAAGLALSLALYPRYNRHPAAVWVFFPFALVLGLLFSRLIYWYCQQEQFASFWDAMGDWNRGSFALFGVIPGLVCAAWAAKRLGLVSHIGRLLDAAAPGVCLSFAFIRLSELWGSACRSRIAVTVPFFQRLPFAVRSADSAGSVTYPLAVFFLSFLALLGVTALLVRFYLGYRRRAQRDGSSVNGNVFRLFLLLWGVTEALVESLRYDSCFMHFTLLKQLNPYTSFVSLGMVFAAVSILGVMLHFSAVNVRGAGWSLRLVLAWLVYLASLVGAGYFGEYRVQRSANYALCYPILALSLLLMAAAVWWVYQGCLAPEEE